ncbi:MAG: DUF4190 domain-containing protein [Candidatus Coproplasma sp.]
MKYCSNCGKELPDEAVFCPACGKSADDGVSADFGFDSNSGNSSNKTNASVPNNVNPPVADSYSMLSILGFVFSFLNSLVGLIISIIALNDAKKTGSEKSKTFAKAGIIISSVCMGLAVLAGIITAIISIIFAIGIGSTIPLY